MIDVCAEGHAAIVDTLLPASNIDDKDKNGMTALMHASYHGHSRIVTSLLQSNCNIDTCDNEGISIRSPTSRHIPSLMTIF